MKKVKEMKVLIIESDKKLEKEIKKHLQKCADKIYTAPRAVEGLKIINTKNPDIVIMNLSLNDISGFELCRLIKNNYPVKVITLTFDNRIISHIRAQQEGADASLSLPFKKDELKLTIEKLF